MSQHLYNIKMFREAVKSVARNQYFYVDIGASIATGDLMTALARSTSLPAVTHGVLDVPFRGLNMRITDRPEFPEWTVTYLCTEDHALRSAHIAWMHKAYNASAQRNFAHAEYKIDTAVLYHLSANHSDVYSYKFFGLFPSAVGEMGVAQEGGEVMQFDVTYSYDLFINGLGSSANTADATIGSSAAVDLAGKVDSAAAELGTTFVKKMGDILGFKLGSSK